MHQSARFFAESRTNDHIQGQLYTNSNSSYISEEPPCYFQDSDYDVHDDVGYGDGPSLRDYDKCLPFGVFSSSAFIFLILRNCLQIQ